jgi:1-acyl-sn-glycerol-3-phosphate acyltransferase
MERAPGGFRSGAVARALAATYLRLIRWRVEGEFPAGIEKAVVVAAPHTSNWDMPHMLAVAFTLGFRPSWLGKKQMFRWPFGGFMRWLGGHPVDRSTPQGLVEQAARAFARSDGMMLVIPPSGTRGHRPYWKSGFYHIAREARVPILLSYLDYRRRAGGVGKVLMPSGDVVADMDVIRAFYADIVPRHPGRVATVRLVDEDAPKAASGGS